MKLQALQTKLNQSCKYFSPLYIHGPFHIEQGIFPKMQLRADMGQGMIAGLIWKISHIYLLIIYFGPQKLEIVSIDAE